MLRTTGQLNEDPTLGKVISHEEVNSRPRNEKTPTKVKNCGKLNQCDTQRGQY